MKLSAIVTKENQWFVAICPELNVVSQGKTTKEALSNLKEAIELYLEDEDVKKVIKNIHPAKIYSLKIPA